MQRVLTVVLGPERDEQERHNKQFRAVIQFQPGATPDAQKRHAKSAQAEQDAIVALGDAAWRRTVIGLPVCRFSALWHAAVVVSDACGMTRYIRQDSSALHART